MEELLLKSNSKNIEVVNDITKILNEKFLDPAITPKGSFRNINNNTQALGTVEDNQTYGYNLNLDNNLDYKFLTGVKTLKMASTPENSINNPMYDCFKGLKQGLFEDYTKSKITNETGVTNYEDEQIIANLFCHIYGYEFVMKCMLESNYQALVEQMIKQGLDNSSNIFRLLTKNNNHLNNNESFLGEIEMELTRLFLLNSNLTEIELSDFRTNLYGNSDVFEDQKAKYQSVNHVYGYFEEMVNSKENNNGKQL